MRYSNHPNALTSEFQSEDRSWRWSLADNQADLVSDQDDQVSKSQIEMDGTQENLLAQYFSRPDLLDQEYELGTQLRRSGNIDISFGKGGSIAPIDDSEDRSLPVAKTPNQEKKTKLSWLKLPLLVMFVVGVGLPILNQTVRSPNVEPAQPHTTQPPIAQPLPVQTSPQAIDEPNFTLQHPYLSYYSSVALGFDGQFLACAGINGETKTNQIEVLYLATGSALHVSLVSNVGRVSAIGLAKQALVSGGVDGTIKFWSHFPNPRLIRTIQGHSAKVESVAISPNGQILATSGDRTIKLWNLQTGVQIRTLHPSKSGAAMALSPDGQMLAVGGRGSTDGTGTIDIWNIHTGLKFRTFKTQQGGVQAVAFSPDGKNLASGGTGDIVETRNLDTGEVHQLPSRHFLYERNKFSVLSIDFRSDGKLVIAGRGSNDAIIIWSVDRPR
jgi:hypothetical protein